MKDVLSPRCRPLLRDLSSHDTLVALDFDGTLAPLVPSRHHARLSPGTARLLAALARTWPCAVLSGRARDDVASRLGPAALRAVVGSHGAEEVPPLRGERSWRRRVATWVRTLRARLAGVRGVDIEDKGLSVSVHVRGPGASRRVHAELVRLAGARIVGGKRVWNVLVREAPGKGASLARLVRRGRHDRVLFVGDDETDEDVFRGDPGVPLVSVRVGRHAGSAASHRLGRQADVARLLAVLVDLRAGPRRRATGRSGKR